eukprot:scaffold6249_cov124-Isochrysis_galbana.AAC.3
MGLGKEWTDPMVVQIALHKIYMSAAPSRVLNTALALTDLAGAPGTNGAKQQTTRNAHLSTATPETCLPTRHSPTGGGCRPEHQSISDGAGREYGPLVRCSLHSSAATLP